MTLEKEPQTTALIRFQDCDPFGHLNNARYIDYFINARQDHLMKFYGFNFFDMGQTENWVITKTQIAYLEPAQLMEEVLIRTRLLQMTDKTIHVEGLMMDNEGKRLKSISWVEFMYVSLKTGRPTNHPDEFLQKFMPLQIDGAVDVQNFNGRVQALKEEFRRNRASIGVN